MPRRNLMWVAVVLLAGGALLVASSQGPSRPVATKPVSPAEPTALRPLLELETIVRSRFVDAMDQQSWVEGAMSGAVSRLDGASHYVPAALAGDLTHGQDGRYVGVGIDLDQRDGRWMVLSVQEHSPAAAAGVQPGDIIVALNGAPISALPWPGVERLLAGQLGTPLRLKLVRGERAELTDLTLTRQEIRLQSVLGWCRQDHGGWTWLVDQAKVEAIWVDVYRRANLANHTLSQPMPLSPLPAGAVVATGAMGDLSGLARDGWAATNAWPTTPPTASTTAPAESPDAARATMPKVGYLHVRRFLPRTASDVELGIRSALGAGATAVILDLRSNPGGSIDAAVRVADLVLPDGLIVTREQRATEHLRYFARREGTLPPIAMAVLVDQFTASSAEIVAGALQDHQRAVIVGERTYGKGTVQELLPVTSTGGYVRLTTGRYRLPNGRLIDRGHAAIDLSADWGIDPDIVIEGTDPASQDPSTRTATQPTAQTTQDVLGASQPAAAHDPVLDAALHWLCTQAHKRQAARHLGR